MSNDQTYEISEFSFNDLKSFSCCRDYENESEVDPKEEILKKRSTLKMRDRITSQSMD